MQEGGNRFFVMKYRWDKKYLYWGITAVTVIVVGLLVFAAIFRFDMVWGFFRTIFAVLTPVLYGFAFAFILNPLVGRLQKLFMKTVFRKTDKVRRAQKVARALSIVLAILLLLVVITLFCLMLFPQLVTNITGFYNNFETYYANLIGWLDSILKEDSDSAKFFVQVLGKSKEMLQNWMSTDLVPQLQNVASNLLSGLWNVFMVLKDVIIGLIIAIYFLFSKEKFCAQCKKMAYAILPRRRADGLIRNTRETSAVFGSFITGQLIDAFIVGILCFIGMTIFRMPYPPMISVIVAITNVIPFFGPYIGAIPSAILILLVDPMQAIYFVIFIIILQQIDGNVICPRILGGTIGLNGFWIIFAIVIFGAMFGFVGMIIGVPTFAMLYTWLRRWVNMRLKKKNMPEETLVYSVPGEYRRLTEEEQVELDACIQQAEQEIAEKAAKSRGIFKIFKRNKHKKRK